LHADSFIIKQDQIESQPAIPSDPASISLAYENLLRNAHSKKYVSEDRLAFGHRQCPSSGQISKNITKIAEEKLILIDKPLIEFNPSVTLRKMMDLNQEKTEIMSTHDK
jgi:hypothetical protein